MINTPTAADVGTLPPTQYLILDVLAARTRLGEHGWTFSSRLSRHLDALAVAGYLNWKAGVVERTCLAWLTDAGWDALLDDGYRLPLEAWREQVAKALETDHLKDITHNDNGDPVSDDAADILTAIGNGMQRAAGIVRAMPLPGEPQADRTGAAP